MDLFVTVLLGIVAFDVLFMITRVLAALRGEPRPVTHQVRPRLHLRRR